MYAAKEAVRQQVEEWETSAEEQAQLAQEKTHHEMAAAKFPGGSARIKLLLAAAAAHGLKGRIDWDKFDCYIRTGVGNPEHLADTMATSRWLHGNTDYAADVERLVTAGIMPNMHKDHSAVMLLLFADCIQHFIGRDKNHL